MPTIRDVAKAAAVSTATVSAVINDSAFVSAELRARVLVAVERLDYAPMSAARTLKRGRSRLLALVVADLANPFYFPVVRAVEAAAEAWGYAVVLFNSDENPERERRILARSRALSCEGVLLVPVGATLLDEPRDPQGHSVPIVLFGRRLNEDRFDTVAIDNVAAGRQVTNYLLDLGHRDIGSVTGPLHIDTGQGRLTGLMEAMEARGVTPQPEHIRSGAFREDVAYSVARDMFARAERPSAVYVANSLMAAGVLRALNDLGLDCPSDVSLAITDPMPSAGGFRPSLTRTEHPVVEMANEAIRLLVERVEHGADTPPRQIVFQPFLVLGESCRPFMPRREVLAAR